MLRSVILPFSSLAIALTVACFEPAASPPLPDASLDGETAKVPAATPAPALPPNGVAIGANRATSPAGPTEQAAPAAATAPTTPAPVAAIGPLGAVGTFSRETLPPAPDRDLFRLAYELLLPLGHPEIEPVVNPAPVSYEAGRVDDFYLVDLDGLEKYQSRFELRLVSPHAYWYVEEGLRVEQDDIERAAAEFEAVIYPRVTGFFGAEWTPGVDNDLHLTIAHGDIRGAGGYFSSTDEYPAAVRPHSNQREMIYINAAYLRVGSPSYYRVLAHELNHAILWHHDRSEDTWVSEGLAELSVTVAGYPSDSIGAYLRRPFVPLVHWPLDDAAVFAHYGGASLFMHYLYEHYGGEDGKLLRNLLTIPADGIEGIDQYLAEAGYEKDFQAVLQDWLAANFLDEAKGVLGYSDLQVQVEPSRRLSRPAELERELAQYGTHYIELGSRLRDGPTLLRFEGAGDNRLLPAEAPETGCWWSNAGDSMMSTLTRSVDLTGVAEVTLSYAVWFSIEKEWDYAYLQVSQDGGGHWDILETPLTSAANPIGVAFGPGYTGKSRGWKTEDVDLSEYAGQRILVRFQYVTDDALNDAGLCLRDLAVTGVDGPLDDGQWKADGFIHIDNRVPQEFIVQVIQKGKANRVEQMPLAFVAPGVWQGELLVEPYDGLERTMVAVTALAPVTREKVEYRLQVEAGSE